MGKVRNWFRFVILKILHFFNIDLLVENKELQDSVFELKKENAELKKQVSSQKLEHFKEREIPPGFKRSHNNILIAPDGTNYRWNCYNKREGAEFRILGGGEHWLGCKVCNIQTQIKSYDSPPREAEY